MRAKCIQRVRYLLLVVVNHDVVRLDVAVHDPAAVAEIKGLEKLKDVVLDVMELERGVQYLEVDVVDVLEYERRRGRLRRD
jgi:hypothetical protein